MTKRISPVFPFGGSFSPAALYHWPVNLLPAPRQREGPWLAEWRAAKNVKPTLISWGHQKAVNGLYIERQLFYINCLLYLHPVPVPGVHNGSMYPKCLYLQPQLKDLFFPSAGLPKEISPIRNLFSPQRRITKKPNNLLLILPLCEHWSTGRPVQVPVAGGRPYHSWSPCCSSFWSYTVTFQTAFQELPAGMPMQRSHALHRDICAHTHTQSLSTYCRKGLFSEQQDKKWVEIVSYKTLMMIRPFDFTTVARWSHQQLGQMLLLSLHYLKLQN